MYQASHARSRTGFTLIELLIVIAIIAVLAALLLAGISAVRWKGYDAQEVNDIKQLEIALNNFKAKYNCYPPSRIVLYPKYSDYNTAIALDKDSLQVINRIWPNIGGPLSPPGTPFANYIHWGNPTAYGAVQPAGFPSTGIILDCDQCLVLFLGGLYDRMQYPKGTMVGFSSNPKNPAQDGVSPERIKFFDFNAGRLNFAKSLASSTPDILFPTFADNYGQMPYVYFAPGLPGSTSPNAYNGNHKVTYDGGTTYVSPYYKTASTYWNPKTFQIISAGRDGIFGNVGQWDNGSSTTDTTGAWKDNRTNFSTFVLAAQAQ